MSLPRRNLLFRLGSGLGLAALSGCAGLPFLESRLTLTLLNFDAESHRLAVELLRTDGRNRSESTALRETYPLRPPPDDDAASEHRLPDVVPSDTYLVRASLDDRPSIRETFHFYPDCTRTDTAEDELYVEIHGDEVEPPTIRFQQNRC